MRAVSVQVQPDRQPDLDLNRLYSLFQKIADSHLYRVPVMNSLLRRALLPALLAFALLFLNGCATVPPEGLNTRDVQSPASFQLTEPIFWKVNREQAGLAPGIYRADKENELGTFYRGPAGAFFFLFPPSITMGKSNPAVLVERQGGLWIPKGAGTPKVYMIMSPDYVSDPGTKFPIGSEPSPPEIYERRIQGVTTAPSNIDPYQQIVVDNAVRNPTGAGVVGGAIGVGLVQAIIEADRGKPSFHTQPPEGSPALRKLVEAAAQAKTAPSR